MDAADIQAGNSLLARQEQLRSEYDRFQRYDLDLYIRSLDTSDANELASIKEERSKNRARLREISTKLKNVEMELMHIEFRISAKLERNRYHRPHGRLGKFIASGLGPLPFMAQLIQPNNDNLKRVGSYRLLAFGLVVAAIGALLLLTHTVSWMRISPMTVIFGTLDRFTPNPWTTILGFAAIIILTKIFNIVDKNSYRTPGVKFWDAMAMREEQWFRMGAENWSVGERVRSCLKFGFVHITNIIYPIASLLVVTAVGVVFMVVYLRTYKKTGDTELATIASAKLHATYNRFALLYMAAAIFISVANSMLF